MENIPYSEASQYHNPQARGFFSLLINEQQRSYRLREMPQVLDNLPSDADVFISQSEFKQPNRRLVNLQRLGLSFVDCETHKTRYKELTPEQQAQAVLLHCEDHGVPLPSLINYSGRGLHVKWPYDTPVPGAALPRWNAVEKHLIAAMEPFGADKAARDGSRCLRVVGSVNSRSGQMARTVWDSGVHHDFDALAHEVLPISREQIQVNRQADKERRKAAGVTANLWTPQTLWWSRLSDIRKLIDLRGWHNGVPEGLRNNFLLVAACASAWGAEPADLPGEVETLAQEFCPSLSLNEVRSCVQYVLREVQAGKRRRFTSERIIELLDIGADEQKQMKTLVDDDLRAERKRRANRKHSDRATYEAQALARREQTQTLRVQGMTYQQIADHVGISLDAVKSLLRNRTQTLTPQVTPYTRQDLTLLHLAGEQI